MDSQIDKLYDKKFYFDIFRSEVCHMYKSKGDKSFIEEVLLAHAVENLWEMKQYAKAFYLIAIIDYLSDKYNIPYFEDYNYYRTQSLKNTLFPREIVLLDKINANNNEKIRAIEKCKKHPIGKYFYRYNIIEGDITDVV